MIFKLLQIIIFISYSAKLWAFQDKSLEKDLLITLAPAQLNSHSFMFEFGYVIPKQLQKVNYHYNAYVVGILKNESEKDSNIKSAGLGAKGGVILPTQIWLPLLFQIAGGYAKTTRQEDPWFGKNDQSLSRRDLFFVEIGLLYTIDKRYLLKFSYEIDSNKNFKNKRFFSFGVNF